VAFKSRKSPESLPDKVDAPDDKAFTCDVKDVGWRLLVC
jgi:hypothetical protein